MIRLAEARDEPHIRACAEQAYARYVPAIGRKPAPMVADFTAQMSYGDFWCMGGIEVVAYPAD